MLVELLALETLGSLITTGLAGFLGNRTDAGLVSGYQKVIENLKKNEKPVNHDLQKAVQRSYIRACKHISMECLEIKTKNKEKDEYAINWLQNKIKSLDAELKQVENLEFKEMPVEYFKDIELFLTPEGKLAEEKIEVVKRKIIDTVLKDGGVPDIFIKKVKERLFIYMCDFFADEIKNNPKVRDIFTVHLITQINSSLKEMKITIELLEKSLKELKDIGQAVFLTLEDYSKMTDIENYRFIGRKNDLNTLNKFLDNPENVMVIIGDGGVGKTRLVLEFARKVEVEGDWDIYFINISTKNLNRLPDGEKILIILDEAARYSDRDMLINRVKEYSRLKNKLIKLILIDRPIFKASIESILKETSIPSMFLEPKESDISGFLHENCNWIPEDVYIDIEKYCEGSFDAAITIAEYYREKGRIDSVQKAYSDKTEKYIRELATEIGKKPDDIDVAFAIRLISLVTPVTTNDIEYLSESTNIKPDIFESILNRRMKSIVSYHRTEDKKEFAIKPDPLADHLRLEFMKYDDFEETWRDLLPYMAFRISYNISVLPRYKILKASNVLQVLDQIWGDLNHLNRTKGHNAEYFHSLVFFTGNLEKYNINLNHWIECYHDLIGSSYEQEVRVQLAKGLYYTANGYGNAQLPDKMEACIQELRVLHSTYPDKEVREWLASGLVIAAHGYEKAQLPDKMEACIQELRVLHSTYPDKEVRELLAGGLFNAALDYENAQLPDKMEAWIQELRTLHTTYPDKKVREWLANGLYNAALGYAKAKLPDKMETCIQELRVLHSTYPEKKVNESFANCLYNAALGYGKMQLPDKMEACIQELRALHSTYPEKEVRETFASCLVNTVNVYGKAQLPDKVETCIQKLRMLQGTYPDKEVREDKMETCIQELRVLHSTYPDEEVRVQLAKGLVNAALGYEKAELPDKMEACIQELRVLQATYPDKEVGVQLAKGLYNAALGYGEESMPDKMESYIQELRTLHSTYPEKEVREWLAKGLYNTLIVFGRKSYDNIVLLYKMRLYLPHDQDMQKRNREIEEMLVEETVKISEIEYKKGAENLKVFLKSIKYELGDETDYVQLMEKVVDKLPLSAQKLIF